MKSERRVKIVKRKGNVLIFAVLFATLAFVSVGCASATIIHVPEGGNQTIQQAVNNAIAGDTIIVRDGTYVENINVCKRLTIQSENGSANCIVHAANPNKHVFNVSADYVNVSGFTVENATGKGKNGIYIRGVNHCNISNNNASNNNQGIILKSSHNNTISNNNVSNSSRYNGITIHNSSYNDIKNNIANANNHHGINLKYSNYNNLTNNIANSNGLMGIRLFASTRNTLTNNSASNNEIGIGVPLMDTINKSYFDNRIDSSNYVNGKPMYGYFNQSDTLIEGLETSHLALCFCSNFTVRNVNVSGGDGIFLRGSTNNTVIDSLSVNNTFGVMLDFSDSNDIANNNLSNNFVGIDMMESRWNNVSNNTLNSNNASGTNLNEFRSLLNGTGIIMNNSDDNQISNNNASDNYGCGIVLRGDSQKNTVVGNNASSNDDTGIKLTHLTSDNSIYNNYFDNTNNSYDDGNNIWNITKTAGTNIIGGPYLGGNYWSDYAGEDLNGDGLGDTLLPYNSSGKIQNGGDWLPLVKPSIFDTGPGTYPSIMGTHEGKIIPSCDINVSKLYTYPCAGTGGHTESIELYENGVPIANGTWNGYQGDYHNITIHNLTGGAPYVTLLKDHKYNYTIKTGSYPQIIHEPSKEVIGGTITCTQFTDVNGRTYDNWIPAIKLE